jgi:hypothetical protein
MKNIPAAAILILMIVAAVFAQPDKDLVGTWKMDASRSKFASSSDAPVLALIKFERVGELLRETLNVTNAAGANTRKIDYAIDGSELSNGSGDERVTSKIVKKDGSIILQWIDDGGVFTRSINISADGRTMTIAAHDSNPDLKRTDDVIVFQRQ